MDNLANYQKQLNSIITRFARVHKDLETLKTELHNDYSMDANWVLGSLSAAINHMPIQRDFLGMASGRLSALLREKS